MSEVDLEAVKLCAEKNVKFADALMGCWGFSLDLDRVLTYDEKDFRPTS